MKLQTTVQWMMSAGAALVLFATAGNAQDVGTVAAASGVAEIGRGGAALPAAVGVPVQLGDELHTGDGQMRVVFQDDSVIDLAERSSLVVDRQVFDPDGGRFSSLMRLVGGKARALVGKYYKTPGASYEVQTPTAVAGVRGTSFMVSYDAATDATQVIGIHGQVAVRSLNERIGDTVYVTAEQGTWVLRDEAPTPPEAVELNLFRHQVEGIEPIALGSLSNVAASHPIGAAGSVAPPESAPSASGLVGQLGRDQLRNIGDVVGQPLNVVSGRGSLGIP